MSKGMKQGGVSLEEDESQISRAWKAVLRNMGFLSKALGSHGGILSKGRPMSAWCFRKTSLAPLRVDWKGQDQGTRGPGDQGGGWGSDAAASGNVSVNII